VAKKSAFQDPGIRGVGISVFHGKTLSRAAYISNPCEKGSDMRAVTELARAVVAWLGPEAQELEVFGAERPQMYDDDGSVGKKQKRKGDQNDLPPLYGIDCAVAALLPPWVELWTPYPRDWKGQVPGDAMCRRIWKALSPEERSRVKIVSSVVMGEAGEAIDLKGNVDHNTLDGVGLGLKYHGRLEIERLLPG
jgi:hypothetical protein